MSTRSRLHLTNQYLLVPDSPTRDRPRWARYLFFETLKLSKYVTLSAFVHRPVLPAEENVLPSTSMTLAPSRKTANLGPSKPTLIVLHACLVSAAREQEDLIAVVFAQGLQGPINENVPTPQVNTIASLRISHQLNENQALFVQCNFQDRWQNNIGVGGTTLAEAGAQSRFREDEFIFNHRAVLTTKLLSQFRILVGRYWSPTNSNLAAAKLVVTDAFTGGGAQADRLSTEFHTSITWLLTQTTRKHTLKYGFNVPDWSRMGWPWIVRRA